MDSLVKTPLGNIVSKLELTKNIRDFRSRPKLLINSILHYSPHSDSKHRTLSTTSNAIKVQDNLIFDSKDMQRNNRSESQGNKPFIPSLFVDSHTSRNIKAPKPILMDSARARFSTPTNRRNNSMEKTISTFTRGVDSDLRAKLLVNKAKFRVKIVQNVHAINHSNNDYSSGFHTSRSNTTSTPQGNTHMRPSFLQKIFTPDDNSKTTMSRNHYRSKSMGYGNSLTERSSYTGYDHKKYFDKLVSDCLAVQTNDPILNCYCSIRNDITSQEKERFKLKQVLMKKEEMIKILKVKLGVIKQRPKFNEL